MSALMGESRGGTILLCGNHGSGKTTALEHLAAHLWSQRNVWFVDDADFSSVQQWNDDRWTIFAAKYPITTSLPTIRLELAPWTEDEAIEYLLAIAKDKCGSVMGRLQSANDADFLDGSPALWRLVLDEMIRDDALRSAHAALRSWQNIQFPQRKHLTVGEFCMQLASSDKSASESADLIAALLGQSSEPMRAVLQHRSLWLLTAADFVAAKLSDENNCSCLAQHLDRDLVDEIALAIAGNDAARQQLERLANGNDVRFHAMAASILLAADDDWRPEPLVGRILRRGYFACAQWAGVELAATNLGGANLRSADLSSVDLSKAVLDRADLADANLSGATLSEAEAFVANLSGANLSDAQAEFAFFSKANLEHANFESAKLRGAHFNDAKLPGAVLRHAELAAADFTGASVEGTDFTGADLSWAILAALDLSNVVLDHANLTGARMTNCDLEYAHVVGVRFDLADLNGALLTGTKMPRASFAHALLRNAGLADVEWENADLRNADLTGASFHLGSSRSGLVFSPIASEGSRTGFYTDDYLDLDVVPPEEIRKANLRGADLRGAKIDGVDFYLVDLRDAALDPSQVQQVRDTGGILDDR